MKRWLAIKSVSLIAALGCFIVLNNYGLLKEIPSEVLLGTALLSFLLFWNDEEFYGTSITSQLWSSVSDKLFMFAFVTFVVMFNKSFRQYISVEDYFILLMTVYSIIYSRYMLLKKRTERLYIIAGIGLMDDDDKKELALKTA